MMVLMATIALGLSKCAYWSEEENDEKVPDFNGTFRSFRSF